MKKLIFQKGFAALFITILILAIIFSIGLSVAILTLGQQAIAANITKSSQAYFASEAGIEDSIYRIVKGKKYEATNSLVVGDGEADISISEEGDSRIIVSSGAVSQRIRKLKVIVSTKTTTVAFHYGAQVDRGGIEVKANASVVGNVYSNGSIKGQGKGSGSKITGDAWVAGGVAPEPDQQWIEQNFAFLFGIKIGPVDILDTAQSFIPSESKILNIVSFYIKKFGEPSDQTVRILTDDGGSPSTTSLASGTLKSSKVTSNYSWVDVSLDPPPNLTAGQTYWIMIDVSRDNNNYWAWGEDIFNGYTRGTGKFTKDWSKGGAIWIPTGGDLNFKTWMGGIITYIDRVWIGNDAHANSIYESWIDRDAYYQTIDDKTTVEGTKYPGSPDPPTKDLPISYAQIQDWEEAAENGGVITCPYSDIEITCVLENEVCVCRPVEKSSLGPIKIEGDLIFPGNSIDTPVIITGPVWVMGKILAENNVNIKLQEGLISGYPIIADNPSDQINYGQIEFNNNVITQDSSGGGYLLFISTNKSLDNANPAFWLHNNVNKDLAQSIVFSLQGLIKVENNAKFKEITGYALYLENNTEIVYEEGLINAGFSSGPGGGWKVASWKEIE